jgi:Bacterial membrane protein YfhO
VAAAIVALSYGPGLVAGGVLVPADMLQAFAPWTEPTSVRPVNGLLGDQIQQIYPWRVLVHQELARGIFPLWNPYGGGGAPLFANGQSAVLFPLNLAVLWLPPELAATATELLKPPLAAAGTALFLRALGVGTAGCVLAGIGWAYSGPMVTWLGWPHTNALLMLPYLFSTTTRWLQSGRWRWWFGLAAALAVQLFGGHPETTAHGLVAMGLFVGAWLVADMVASLRATGHATLTPLLSPLPQGGRAAFARAVRTPLLRGGGWLVALGAGVAVAAVQVVPLLAAISESVTAAERSGRGLAALVLDRETLLTWLVPNYFGSPLAQTIGPLNYLNYNETLGYVGLATVVLAVASALWPSRRGWAGLVLLTLVALGLTYGLPLLTELRRLPGLDYAANTRFVFIAAFGLACLGGLGVDLILRHARPWPALAAAAGCAGIGVMAAGLALAPDLLTPSAAGALPLTPLDAAWLRQRELWKAAGIASAAALVLALAAARPRWGAGWRAAAGVPIVLAVGVDLFLFGRSYNPTTPADLLRQTPEAVAFIQREDPSGRVIGLGEALLPNTSILVGLNDLRVYEPVADHRLMAFFERIDPFLQTDIRSRFYLFVWNPNVELLRLASVRWVLVPLADRRVVPESQLANAGLVRRYADAVTAVWEVPQPAPRAYFEDLWQEVNGEQTLFNALGVAPGQRTVIEGAAPPQARGSRANSSTDVSTVSPRFSPGRIVLDVMAARPGLTVVNEALYSGWDAWVDGVKTPIFRANGIFMAVPVVGGHHTVVLEYRPPAFFLGLGISVASALLIVFAAVLGQRRRLSDASTATVVTWTQVQGAVVQ